MLEKLLGHAHIQIEVPTSIVWFWGPLCHRVMLCSILIKTIGRDPLQRKTVFTFISRACNSCISARLTVFKLDMTIFMIHTFSPDESIFQIGPMAKIVIEGYFTHEPRDVTMQLWEPKRESPKTIPRHLQNHVVWSQTLKCSVKSDVTRPSTKCHFNEFLFMRVLPHETKSMVVNVRSAMVSRFCVRPTSKRWFLKLVQVIMNHDPFDAMQESM
jgi:hypothetical protein